MSNHSVEHAALEGTCLHAGQWPDAATMLSAPATSSLRQAEVDRLAALTRYDVLDTSAEACFDRISRAAADVCGTKMALISLVDEHRQWFKSNVGVPATETSRDIAFCAHAIFQDGLFTVEDAACDPRFADNPLVQGPLGVRFYVGAPLITPAGQRIGTLCVLDTVPRPGGLTTREQSILQAMAAQVISELELRLALRLAERQRIDLEETGLQLSTLKKCVAEALDLSGVGVWEWDGLTDKVRLIEGAFAIGGAAALAPDWLEPLSWTGVVHPEDRPIMRARFRDYVGGLSQSFECEVRMTSDHGAWRWVLCRGSLSERASDGRTLKISGTLTDIDARRRAEDKLHWAVHHDALTGLANRRLFYDRLETALKTAQSHLPCGRVGLALLDLDLFKQVNDVFGHAAGDALLQAIAQRLRVFQRPGETSARLGGDEFTLILPNCGSEDEIQHRLTMLLETLREPFEYEGHLLDCRASVGFTCYPEHGFDAATLLKNADLAMFRAKASGRDAITVYEPALAVEVERRVAVRDTVRAAVRAQAIIPFYQAQIAADSGRLSGYEALFRIRRSDGNIGLPASVEEAFDDSDLGMSIGRCMLEQVIKDMVRWSATGVHFGHIGINASAMELRRGDYAERVLGMLAAAGVPPCRLHIELVETVFLGRGSEKVEATVRTLNQAGVKIALDDFGTGFASLTHLKKFPIDIIKIDKSFVRDLELGSDDIAIVEAVTSLAGKLGIHVVAEGVETAGQASVLRANGCSVLQGYYFHRPCPGEEVPETSRLFDVRSRQISSANIFSREGPLVSQRLVA